MNNEQMDRALAEWEKNTLEPTLHRFPERRDYFSTPSDIEVQRIYTPASVQGDYLTTQGFPGQYPFTRGVQPTLYRGQLWTMRQYAGYASAEESNERFRYLLQEGQTGLSVAFDLPTQMGYDSDDPLAEGEVGRVGVAVSSVEDMETLFRGIPLDKVSTSMTINAPAAILLAMYVVVAQRQGVDIRELRGTIQNDILKEYVARGTYIFPPAPSMRLITDVFKYCGDNLPRWNVISISGYHIREAGANAVQELGFTLANAIAYVEAAIEAGLDVDTFAGQLSFFFSAHNNLLEEVAKFRAARRLWARIVRERFQAQDPKTWRLRFHTQTAGSTLTAQQPDNNVVRVTLQALAAVLGGTQSLHTNSRDEALSLPTEDSVRIALRTQQIIAHESGVGDSVDPLAGSYYLEWLTDEVERRVQAEIDRIDKMGGALAAIDRGYMQGEIQKSAYRYQRQVDAGEMVVVGVNDFRTDQDTRLRPLKVDAGLRERRVRSLADRRSGRDQARVMRALSDLERAALGSAELMGPIVACVEAAATLGEICQVLRCAYGEYRSGVIA